jgi:cilia- and flagella-associated protein 53
MDRAYALRDARERERQEYVHRRYDDQWRDSCDDARTLDSKATVIFMNKERVKQIGEKLERKQELSRIENSFLEAWNRQLDELERREQEKKEYRHRMEMETSKAIRAQIEQNQQAKENYYRSLMAEEQAELERVSILIIVTFYVYGIMYNHLKWIRL